MAAKQAPHWTNSLNIEIEATGLGNKTTSEATLRNLHQPTEAENSILLPETTSKVLDKKVNNAPPLAVESEATSRDLEKGDVGDSSKMQLAATDGIELTDSIYSVYWSEPIDQDPENPMNWTTKRKWSIIGVLSFLSFLT